ncbi:molybdenum cofactor guanylyltransferase [Planctomycetota bacterium]
MYEATGIILAGGAGSRLKGVDKARLVIDSTPLIERAVELLRDWFAEVLIVSNGQRHYEFERVKLLADEKPNCGPLMGLYTALKASRHELNLVLACDMPYVSRKLVQMMMETETSGNYDVVTPVVNGYREPFLAVYHKQALEIIKRNLDRNRYKMTGIFEQMNVGEISEERLRQIDPELKNFININTPEDLEAAQKTWPTNKI